MKMKGIMMSLLFASAMTGTVSAQFEGTYDVSVKQEKRTDSLQMHVSVKGVQSAIEIQGMKGRGMTKSIYNKRDKTVVMLMDRDGKKMAMKQTVMDAKSVQASTSADEPNIKVTQDEKLIQGLKCTKVIVESKNARSEMWVTDQVTLTMSDFMGAFSGRNTKMYAQQLPQSHEKINGVAIEIYSRDKATGLLTTITINNLKKEIVDDKIFSLDGYDVMEMPAGGSSPGKPGSPPAAK